MIQYFIWDNLFYLRRQQMADKNENITQLDELTSKKDFTQDDTQKLQEIFNQLASEFSGANKLSNEDLNSIRSFAHAHPEDFKNALGGLEGALRNSFIASLQKAQAAQTKQETKADDNKNNFDPIISKMHDINKKKKITNTDKKAIITSIVELNKEIENKKTSFAQISEQDKKTLQTVFANFKEEFEEGFNKIPTEELNPVFVELYNATTGSKKASPNERKNVAKMGREFTTMLSKISDDFAKEDAARQAAQQAAEQDTQPSADENQDNNDTPQQAPDVANDELYDFIRREIPTLSEDDAKAVEDVWKQTADNLNEADYFKATINDEFIVNLAVAIDGMENLSPENKESMVSKLLEWERDNIHDDTASLLVKKEHTDEEFGKLSQLLRHPEGRKVATGLKVHRDGLNNVLSESLDKPKDQRTDNEKILAGVIATSPALTSAVEPTIRRKEQEATEQNIQNTIDILKIKEEDRTPEQKEDLERLLATDAGQVGLAVFLSEKDVKDLTDEEKAQLKEVSTKSDVCRSVVAAKLAELEAAEREGAEPETTPTPAPAPEPTPAPAPEPTVPDVTDDEVSVMIQQLEDSENAQAYIKNINPKPSNSTIEEVVKGFDDPKSIAVAFANPDDMLVAYERVQEKYPEYTEQMEKSIRELLTMVKPEDINPDNAFALNELVKRAGYENEEDALAAQKKIAQGLKKYDNETFGTLSDAELAKNYETVQNLFQNNKELRLAGSDYLDRKFLFTDDKGKPLKEKEAEKCKQSVIEMARELVAQDLAKEGLTTRNPDGTIRDLTTKDYKDKIQDKINLLVGIHGRPGTDGKTPVTQSQVIGSMGVHMARSETFKNRAKQRGGAKGKLYKSSSTWLQRLDKRLTKRFGAKYTKAKKFAKTLGKVAIQSAIGAAKFAVIGAVAGPVGIGVYMAYNSAKLWKNVGQELKGKSGLEKTAIIAGKVAVTAISAGMVVSGVGDMLPADGLSALATNFASHVASSDILTRTAVTTAANTLPNLVKTGILAVKDHKVKKAIKNETDPAVIKALIEQEKGIMAEKMNNREELFIKTASAAVGTAAGVYASQHITPLIQDGLNHLTGNADVQQGAAPENMKENADTTKQNIDKLVSASRIGNGEMYDNSMSDIADKLYNQFGSQGDDILLSAVQNPNDFLGQFSESQLSAMGLDANSSNTDIINALANPDNNAILCQVPELNMALVGGENYQEANVYRATETRMHPSGKSVSEMASADLEKIGLGDLSTKMQEGYGENAYKAIHSALAEPTNVVEALKSTMPAEDFAKLGFDNNPSSPEVARVLANNPQLASNEGLRTFMSDHFNAAQEFSWSEGVQPTHDTPTNTATPTQATVDTNAAQATTDGAPAPTVSSGVADLLAQREQNIAKSNENPSTDTRTLAERVIAERENATLEVTKTTVESSYEQKTDIKTNTSTTTGEVTVTQEVHTLDLGGNTDATAATLINTAQAQTTEPPYGSPEYLASKGLVYDPEFSIGINHGDGQNTGYLLAARDQYGHIHYIPNDPNDTHMYRTCEPYQAISQIKHHSGPYNGGACSHYHPHNYHGSGYTTPYDGSYHDAVNQVHRVMGAIDHGIHTTEHLIHAGERMLHSIDRACEVIGGNRGHDNGGHAPAQPSNTGPRPMMGGRSR